MDSNTCNSRAMLERRAPRPQEQLNCPRCNSTNTKFCYYNNYSLTQPRYFCKTCRRYWTEGGSLRNVPVGGGSRKNKRFSSSSSSSASSASSAASTKVLPDLNPPNLSQFSSPQNPNKTHKGQDLNLSFPETHHHHGLSHFVELPKSESNTSNNNNSQNNSPLPALELLRTGIASRGLNSFIPTPMPPDSNTLYSSSAGFAPMQEFKPNLSFSIDGLGNRYGNLQAENNNNGGRIFFPFGELKQLSSTNEVDHHNKGSQGNNNNNNNNPAGYWTGMLGGGGSW